MSTIWHAVTPRTVTPPDVPPNVVLTDREMEVAVLVANGCSNKEVAAALGVGLQTVKNHLAAVFRRTGIENRTRFAVWVFAAGIARLDEEDRCRA